MPPGDPAVHRRSARGVRGPGGAGGGDLRRGRQRLQRRGGRRPRLRRVRAGDAAGLLHRSGGDRGPGCVPGGEPAVRRGPPVRRVPGRGGARGGAVRRARQRLRWSDRRRGRGGRRGLRGRGRRVSGGGCHGVRRGGGRGPLRRGAGRAGGRGVQRRRRQLRRPDGRGVGPGRGVRGGRGRVPGQRREPLRRRRGRGVWRAAGRAGGGAVRRGRQQLRRHDGRGARAGRGVRGGRGRVQPGWRAGVRWRGRRALRCGARRAAGGGVRRRGQQLRWAGRRGQPRRGPGVRHRSGRDVCARRAALHGGRLRVLPDGAAGDRHLRRARQRLQRGGRRRRWRADRAGLLHRPGEYGGRGRVRGRGADVPRGPLRGLRGRGDAGGRDLRRRGQRLRCGRRQPGGWG